MLAFLNRKMDVWEHIIGVSMMFSLIGGAYIIALIDVFLLYILYLGEQKDT